MVAPSGLSGFALLALTALVSHVAGQSTEPEWKLAIKYIVWMYVFACQSMVDNA